MSDTQIYKIYYSYYTVSNNFIQVVLCYKWLKPIKMSKFYFDIFIGYRGRVWETEKGCSNILAKAKLLYNNISILL